MTGISCEIVTVGSELLLGAIEDTNSGYIARELAQTGISVRFRTSVGDRQDEIAGVISAAAARCDAVIVTGGLGPTRDDLTREAVASAAGVELEFREDLLEQIEKVFQSAGYEMPDNNRKQAFIPRGSKPVPNPVGTAPGFIAEVGTRPVICLPGVPRELKYLLEKEILPWLKERFSLGSDGVVSRVLKVIGIGESKVDSLVGDLIRSEGDLEVGLLASMGEIRVVITARARDRSEALERTAALETEIRSRLGKKVFGQDEDTLEGVIEGLLTDRNLTLSVMETFTGGAASGRLHALPSSRLQESRVRTQWGQAAAVADEAPLPGEEGLAVSLASRIRKEARADLGLAIVGFPEQKAEKEYVLEAEAAVSGRTLRKSFRWKMGGDLPTLQQRGSVIGLNTLRLALLDLE